MAPRLLVRISSEKVVLEPQDVAYYQRVGDRVTLCLVGGPSYRLSEAETEAFIRLFLNGGCGLLEMIE